MLPPVLYTLAEPKNINRWWHSHYRTFIHYSNSLSFISKLIQQIPFNFIPSLVRPVISQSSLLNPCGRLKIHLFEIKDNVSKKFNIKDSLLSTFIPCKISIRYKLSSFQYFSILTSLQLFPITFRISPNILSANSFLRVLT